ncbi:MAG: hypothetical protein ACD_75C01395G0003 [uncultured bacterium]|nr:MAG: hypothetical protein ACD_75C01395G0003 [uncultured bacterium]
MAEIFAFAPRKPRIDQPLQHDMRSPSQHAPLRVVTPAQQNRCHQGFAHRSSGKFRHDEQQRLPAIPLRFAPSRHRSTPVFSRHADLLRQTSHSSSGHPGHWCRICSAPPMSPAMSTSCLRAADRAHNTDDFATQAVSARSLPGLGSGGCSAPTQASTDLIGKGWICIGSGKDGRSGYADD